MRPPRERRISIKFPSSESGKILLRCPLTGCEPADFYLGQAPPGKLIAAEFKPWIRRQPGMPGVTCPYCGHDDDDDRFRHPDDQSYLNRRIEHEAKQFAAEVIDHHLREFEKSLARSARGGFIQLKVKSLRPRRLASRRPMVPRRQDFLRNVACHVCDRGYGVFALALFCPDCGAPNLSTHIKRERELAEEELTSVDELKNQGCRERAERRLANIQEDAISVTEKFFRTIYEFILRRRCDVAEVEMKLKKVGNAFQSLARGRKLFDALEIDPCEGIWDEDMEFLQNMMAKRHVVTHNLGLADEKYVSQIGEGRTGRNVPVSASDIRRYFTLLEQIVGHCEGSIPEFRPFKP